MAVRTLDRDGGPLADDVAHLQALILGQRKIVTTWSHGNQGYMPATRLAVMRHNQQNSWELVCQAHLAMLVMVLPYPADLGAQSACMAGDCLHELRCARKASTRLSSSTCQHSRYALQVFKWTISLTCSVSMCHMEPWLWLRLERGRNWSLRKRCERQAETNKIPPELE